MIMKKEVLSKLKKKLQKTVSKCPICKKDEWTMPEHVFTIVEHNSLGGTTTPVIAVICSNCGYQLHFNAIILGIIKKTEPKKTKKKKKKWWHNLKH